MKIVSVTELRKHLGYYLKLSESEDIGITKRGEVIAVLSNTENSFMSFSKKLSKLNKYSENKADDEIVLEEIMKRNGLQ